MANIIDSFIKMNNTKKVVYLILIAAGISAGVMLFQWAAQPEYQTLFSNLSSEDSASIIDELRKRKIPYKVEAGGVIMVPQEDIYETRIELAGSGLPKGGGVGFEIFDKSTFGMTEFTEKVNYLRALQGELSRTISWLSEVEMARVHIVVPEKRVFLENKDTARASVIVKLRPGRNLRYNQVQGIVHLVSSSVSGLSPENVTIVDTEGNLLTRSTGGNTGVLSPLQMEYKGMLEKRLESRIQDMLEPIVGAGKVVAKVSADIDFKRVEKTEERFDPDSVVVRSEQRSKEESSGGGAGGGVPGLLSNTPKGKGAKGVAAAIPKSKRQNEVVNYEISKIVSHIVEPSGLIKRLSVAVLVDGSYKTTKTPDGKENKEYLPRSEEEIKKFENLVKNAVGFVSERGDTVEVVNIPFESKVDLNIGEAEGGANKDYSKYIPAIIRYVTILILSLLLFLFVLRPLISYVLKGGGSAGGLEAGLPEAIKALEEGLGQRSLPSSPADLKQRVMELAQKNPQQAAKIIKAWVNEG